MKMNRSSDPAGAGSRDVDVVRLPAGTGCQHGRLGRPAPEGAGNEHAKAKKLLAEPMLDIGILKDLDARKL
jgi:hypothetical protein